MRIKLKDDELKHTLCLACGILYQVTHAEVKLCKLDKKEVDEHFTKIGDEWNKLIKTYPKKIRGAASAMIAANLVNMVAVNGFDVEQEELDAIIKSMRMYLIKGTDFTEGLTKKQ